MYNKIDKYIYCFQLYMGHEKIIFQNKLFSLHNLIYKIFFNQLFSSIFYIDIYYAIIS